MNSTELRPAYTWDCDECGIENFERTISISLEELSEEGRSQFTEEQLEEFLTEEGTFNSMPDTVKCKNCKTEYITYHMLYGDEEDVV